MKRYMVSVVRERLSEALDEAERGVPVFIERKGTRFRLSVEPSTKARRSHRPRIEVLDPAITDGQWTWDWEPGRLKFRRPRRA
jgi:antitoxin (DNA-binding transcriptional repressor) of toxin-antitoxin stability system